MLKHLIIALGIIALLYPPLATKAFAPSPVEEPPAIIRLEDLTIEEQVAHFFPEEHALMLAIFKAESSLNTKAKNYNCRYTREDGTKYSTSCKTVADRETAWSVDCGIAQINVKGRTCPEHLLSPVANLEIAKAKRKAEGLKAWVVYTNGMYKKYLN